ncbi:MAG: hypothetical protein EA351_02005 [Gemmatimonadales bacterium]|nr:MAG: hypothetical protein EA351_02005 [Gemmatimonadales bacterium]
MSGESEPPRRVGLLVLALFGLLWAQPVAGQGAAALASSCAGGGPAAVQTTCADAALAALALQHGYGLVMAAGGPVPASPSTAGNRLHGSPRWIVDAGLGWSTFRRPDLTDGQRRVRRTVAAAPRLSVVAGVFEGFAPAPTVGGMGAVDLVGEVRILPVPVMDGVSGRAASFGAGARVGVLRESFTFPGVTLTFMHRRAGALDYRGEAEPRAEARIQPRVSSLRAVVGKDLWEIGVSGGVQWDRIRGDARARARVGGQDFASGAVSLPASRSTYFLGLNRTWVVAQMTGELGWSPASGSGEGLQGTGPYSDPTSGLSGALSVRITY